MTHEKDRPVVVLGIDPGAGGAGYCAWDAWESRPLYIGSEMPAGRFVFDALVIESGFIGKMGKRQMWGLGFDAGRRLERAIAQTRPGEIYTIRPDGRNGWRANLPKRPGTFQEYDGLPGDVIVNRLRARYGFGAERTEHEIEACGIAEAAAAILQRPKAKDRKALVRVK